MEKKTALGEYAKYDECDENGSIELCTQKVWQRVYNDSKSRLMKRRFTEDFVLGLLIPFIGTSLAAAIVFLLKNVLKDNI